MMQSELHEKVATLCLLFLQIRCVINITCKSISLNFGDIHFFFYFFFFTNNCLFHINPIKVYKYLLLVLNFSNDPFICLTCHQYIQNPQNVTQCKVIHFSDIKSKSLNLEFLICKCLHFQIIKSSL